MTITPILGQGIGLFLLHPEYRIYTYIGAAVIFFLLWKFMFKLFKFVLTLIGIGIIAYYVLQFFGK